jgi:hypothetical protein
VEKFSQPLPDAADPWVTVNKPPVGQNKPSNTMPRKLIDDSFETPHTSVEENRELIIADGSAPDILELLQGARLPVIAIGTTSDPLAAITTALAGEPLATLHIVAHGRAGHFRIGGQHIGSASLRAAAPLLAQWNVKRIALWSCAAGADAELIHLLQHLSGADVLASDQAITAHHNALFRLDESERPCQYTTTLASLVSPASLSNWKGSLVSTVYNANYGTLSFEYEKNSVEIKGDGKSAGDIVKYINVITIGGQAPGGHPNSPICGHLKIPQ